MKLANKKRIEELEKSLSLQRKRPKYAKVCYGPHLFDSNQKSYLVDADVVLILPDNGRRFIDTHFMHK